MIVALSGFFSYYFCKFRFILCGICLRSAMLFCGTLDVNSLNKNDNDVIIYLLLLLQLRIIIIIIIKIIIMIIIHSYQKSLNNTYFFII